MEREWVSSIQKFIYWNILFIITDMVAAVITGTSFTVPGVILEWLWWNIAFCLVMVVALPAQRVLSRLSKTLQRVWRRK